MIETMLCCGVLWLVYLGTIMVGRRLVTESRASILMPGHGLAIPAVGALSGGGAGLVLWAMLLLGRSPTMQMAGDEFGWLLYVTRYPLQAILGGGLVGLVAAVSLQRDVGSSPLELRAVGVLGLSWAVYGLVLAQVPIVTDLPEAVTLAQRATAALGCAAVTIVVVDWYRSPPLDARLDARLLERVLITVASLLVMLLAQTVVWDELLARALGLPVR